MLAWTTLDDVDGLVAAAMVDGLLLSFTRSLVDPRTICCSLTFRGGRSGGFDTRRPPLLVLDAESFDLGRVGPAYVDEQMIIIELTTGDDPVGIAPLVRAALKAKTATLHFHGKDTGSRKIEFTMDGAREAITEALGLGPALAAVTG